jgi:hypothetical protein
MSETRSQTASASAMSWVVSSICGPLRVAVRAPTGSRARHGIHAGRRLVQHDHARVADQPARQVQALFHPAAEVLDPVAGPFCEAEPVEEGVWKDGMGRGS